MQDWSDGYVTGMTYTFGYYRELSPEHINLVALIRNVAPRPLDGPFSYCELGCGFGVSSLIHAATHPGGTFHAVDFNPAHVAYAQGVAARAGLDNVTFHERSFADLKSLDLPSFDFICLHGVWSWINEDNRRAVANFIAQRLKPGGLVYNSYNSLPGWSRSMPIRQFLYTAWEESQGAEMERINQAIGLLEKAQGLNLGVFNADPVLENRLKLIKGANRSYLAHEYLNRDWRPFYHHEVVRELSPAKLDYVGSGEIIHNFEGYCLKPEATELLNTVPEGPSRQTMRDYFMNLLFRKDVFVRGQFRLAPREQGALFERSRFRLTVTEASIGNKFRVPQGEIATNQPFFGRLLKALASEPKTIGQLRELPELGNERFNTFVLTLCLLCASGQAAPAQDGDAGLDGARRLNAVLLEKSTLRNDGPPFLACAATGSGLPVDWFHQLMIWAMGRVGEDGTAVAPEVWAVLNGMNLKLAREGVPLSTAEENLAEIATRFERFRSDQYPLLHQLGIV